MDATTQTLVLTALGATVTGLAGFVVYLIKYVLADKERQITELNAKNEKEKAELTEDRDQWIQTALTALKAAETLAKPVAEQAIRPRKGAGL